MCLTGVVSPLQLSVRSHELLHRHNEEEQGSTGCSSSAGGCALSEEALKHIDICSEYFHDLRDTYGQDLLPHLRLISQDWFKS
jgi:hypothetical protein